METRSVCLGKLEGLGRKTGPVPCLFLCLKVVCPSVTWEPLLGLLQLLHALDGVRLVLGPPLGHLAVGLGQRPLQLSLGFLLLLVLFPQQVTVVAGGLQGVGQRALGLRKSGERRGPMHECFRLCA